MSDAPVGVMHMPRTLFTTALAAFALLVSGLVLSAPPAHAEWTRPGDLTRYRVCKAATDELQISTVRVEKSPQVRVTIWQEAGDRDSSIGTALEMNALEPHKIRHC